MNNSVINYNFTFVVKELLKNCCNVVISLWWSSPTPTVTFYIYPLGKLLFAALWSPKIA